MRLFGRGNTALSTSATFMGIGAGAPVLAGKKADDDDMKDGKKDEKGGDDADAAGKEPAPDGKPPAKGKKKPENPDDDDDDKDGEGDDDEDGDDDTDETDMRKGEKKAVRSARCRERARCAAIFAHKGADQKLEMAGHLAFNTSMGRDAACAMLDRTPVQAGVSGLDAGMAPHAGRNPGPNTSADVTSKDQVDARWDAAMERAKPKSKRQ